jgi:CelD/BcsL family acetyltransferase involved in cellulose biosynthesis
MAKMVIAQSAEELEALASAWQELYSHSEATIFQSPAWNLLAARIFASRQQPYVIYAESAGGRALIPAALQQTPPQPQKPHSAKIVFLGDELFDYRDVLCRGDSTLLPAAWSALAKLGLPLEITALQGPQQRLSETWTGFDLQPFCLAPMVKGGAQEFAGRHPRLARQLRRMEKAGIRLHCRSGDNAALIAAIYQGKAKQFGGSGNNLFADPLRLEFLLQALRMPMSQCDIFTLETPSALAAALVTLRDRQWRRFYTTYFDPRWARLSPGITLLFEITRQSLAEGLLCDYMTGEHPHKARLTTQSVPLFRIRADAAQLELASMMMRQPVAA